MCVLSRRVPFLIKNNYVSANMYRPNNDRKLVTYCPWPLILTPAMSMEHAGDYRLGVP